MIPEWPASRLWTRLTRTVLLVVLFAGASLAQEHIGVSQQPLTSGGPADREVRPYAAFLTLHSKNGTTHRCTGTLISPTVILTAAHCIVCTQSVTAQIYGDVGFFEHPLPGEAPIKTHASSSVAFNPAAYPSGLPDCLDTDDGEVFAEIDKFTRWGGDVAVVHLAQPVTTVQPAGILLFPSRGFAPVQALFNKPLALVGRGFNNPADANPFAPTDLEKLKTMREGWTSITAFRNGLGSAESNNERFGVITSAPDNTDASGLLGGDSGGPMFASLDGSGPADQVIGVASASRGGSPSVHAPTFRLPNSAFLYQHLNGSPASAMAVLDSDDDGVVDSADNCRGTFNPDQIDRDDDSVGDVCDNCTPSLVIPGFIKPLDQYDGTPSSQYAASRNPLQENANGEAENEILRALNAAYLAQGEGREPSATEYFEHFKEFRESPFIAALKRTRKGDTCDPVPVAVPLVRNLPLPASAITGGGMRSRTRNDWIIVERISMPGEIAINALVDAASGPQPGAVGVRYCRCNGPHATEADRRKNCGLNTAANCAIDGARYTLQDAAWRLLSVNASSGQADALVNATFAPPKSSPKPVFQWDALADLTRLTGQALPPQPWTVSADGSIAGFPQLNGILWMHVDSYRGLPTQSAPPTPGPAVGQLANAYLPVDIRPQWVVTNMKRVGFKPPPPWTYCAPCEAIFMTKWLWAIDESPLVSLDGAIINVAHAFTPEALRLLAAGDIRIGDKTGASTRMLVVNSRTMNVAGALTTRGGRIEGQPFRNVRTLERSTEQNPTLAYSSVTDRLFALSMNRGGLTQLSIWSAESGWVPAERQPENLGESLAMVVTPQRDRLLVVDRKVRDGSLRLVLVDPLTGRTTVVADRIDGSRGASVAIANSTSGRLIMALSQENRTRLTHLEIAADRNLSAADWYEVDGALLGDIAEDDSGVHFVTLRGDEPALHSVSATDFHKGKSGSKAGGEGRSK